MYPRFPALPSKFLELTKATRSSDANLPLENFDILLGKGSRIIKFVQNKDDYYRQKAAMGCACAKT